MFLLPHTVGENQTASARLISILFERACWRFFDSCVRPNLGRYNEIYGSLGAVIILLMWFWFSAFVVFDARAGMYNQRIKLVEELRQYLLALLGAGHRGTVRYDAGVDAHDWLMPAWDHRQG
ncbi:YihY/virulence factor BrkB family protein [Halomonas sediminis]